MQHVLRAVWRLIGEGPRSTRPLPHHRTCRSASGGSPVLPKTTDTNADRHQTKIGPVADRHGPTERSGACEPPVALPAGRPLASLLVWNTEGTEGAGPGAVALPLFPADLPQSTTEPLVKLIEHRGRFGQGEVGGPTCQEPVEEGKPDWHGDRATTGSEFA